MSINLHNDTVAMAADTFNNEYVLFEHELRRRINNAVKVFDRHVALYDVHNCSVTINYDHNDGEGMWATQTWHNGARITTSGAVLEHVMKEHKWRITRNQALRKLPSLLAAPTTGATKGIDAPHSEDSVF